MQPNEGIDAAGSVDPDEVARFDRLGEDWWDPQGPMRALHQFNPLRVSYLRRLIASRRMRRAGQGAAGQTRRLDGLAVLDIGCGAGILSESLARLGAQMTAIDPASSNIAAARRHAQQSGLIIDYRCTSAEALAAEGTQFDVVLAMEVVEHVRDVKAFIATAAEMVKPCGLLVAATLNRTLKSYALAILGAEYVLNWVPKGTHKWAQFVTPRELATALHGAGLHIVEETGVSFDPLTGQWQESADMSVNYIIAAEKG